MKEVMGEVAVVILNYNTEDLLKKFLPTVIKYSDGARIVVADNASSDGSVSMMKSEFPEVELIQLEENYGFTGGYNRALSQVDAKYFVLLNSDVEVTAGWLTPMVELMEDDIQIAACQPKIKSYHQKHLFEHAGAAGGMIDYMGYPFCRGRIMHTVEEDFGQYDDVVGIFWATGACMLVRADLYKEFGGLEEIFFAHMEEIDLCWRFKNAGFKILYCGQSEVYHVGGGTLNQSSPRKTYFNFRNGLLLLYKNLPAYQLFYKIFVRMLLDGVAGVRFLMNGEYQNFKAVIRAHFGFYKRINKVRRARKDQYSPSIKMDIYPRLIVFEYFLKKKSTFPKLGVKTKEYQVVH